LDARSLHAALPISQARGKIVVASNLGGLPELVEDGVTGFLAAAGDAAALALALRKAAELAEPARATMGAEARRRALGRFTRDGYFAAMTSLYADLLRRTAGRRSAAGSRRRSGVDPPTRSPMRR
jgi:glycosyltransferase involved in cell wall biosynthesis